MIQRSAEMIQRSAEMIQRSAEMIQRSAEVIQRSAEMIQRSNETKIPRRCIALKMAKESSSFMLTSSSHAPS